MADSDSNIDVNVRSDSDWIAHTVGRCARCGAPTRLVALALPPSHQSLLLDADVGQTQVDCWESASASAFLFYVEYLPEPVQRRVAAFCRAYRFAFSERSLGWYWANHCETCGVLLDDHELFCEPEGPFLPPSAESASAVMFVRIEETLEAAASGYACEPQFFDAMVAS